LLSRGKGEGELGGILAAPAFLLDWCEGGNGLELHGIAHGGSNRDWDDSSIGGIPAADGCAGVRLEEEFARFTGMVHFNVSVD